MAKAKKAKRSRDNTRGPLRTTGKGELVGVRVLPPLLTRIDEWSAKHGDKITRQEAMRRLIVHGLDAAAPVTHAQTSPKAAAKASKLAGQMIDMLGDGTAPIEEREKRKRQLVKGPSEFREIRADLPETKSKR
jgi:hypothetical protein